MQAIEGLSAHFACVAAKIKLSMAIGETASHSTGYAGSRKCKYLGQCAVVTEPSRRHAARNMYIIMSTC